MPRTESRALELGTAAPDFLLPDAFGQDWSLQDFAAPALLVAFISNRCPFVVLIRDRLAALARAYGPGRLAVIAINANDAAAHPEESLARMAEEAAKVPYGFPYLKDEGQDVAKAYGAACTPDFFLYDRERRLAYHGQFDDARPSNGREVTGADLRAAIEAVLAGQRPSGRQIPSIGCNIKWRAGQEPSWFAPAEAA